MYWFARLEYGRPGSLFTLRPPSFVNWLSIEAIHLLTYLLDIIR